MPELQLRALREFVERLRRRNTGMRRAARTEETSGAPAPERVPETPARHDAPSDAPSDAPRTAAPERERDVDGAPDPAIVDSRPTHGRYIPVAARRTVWGRDAGRCAYVDERGRRCSERRGLHVHHRDAHALGGPPTVDNLELRCPAHNTLAAEQDFGRDYMDWMRGKEVRGELFARSQRKISGTSGP